MTDHGFPLRIFAFVSFVLGIAGSLLALSAMIWFGIVYSSSTEYGYFWFAVLLLYLTPSAFGMLATQLRSIPVSIQWSSRARFCGQILPAVIDAFVGMELAFNMKKTCWWCCLCCFPFHATITRAFTNLAMITGAIGLVQISWQSLFTYRTFDETMDRVHILITLFYFSLGSTCLSCFMTATFLLHLRTDKVLEDDEIQMCEVPEYAPLMDFGGNSPTETDVFHRHKDTQDNRQ